jgi:hypothetical protein
MERFEYNTLSKILWYLVFCVIMWAVTVAWAVATAMDVNSNIRSTTYQFMVLFGIFMYISYLFWGKSVILIPIFIVIHAIYKNLLINTREIRF